MLDLDRVSACYGRARILHDIGFSVVEGQVVALLGRNGAGKTTTMKTIMGLLRPESGEIRFQGRSIAGLPPHEIAKLGLGYVPEERRIFSQLSVQENLEVGRQPRREGFPFWDEARLFALFPNLAERRANLGKQLSGGEQQMLTIARTLMGNPAFILLDEPSEGIAPVIVEQMAFTIREMKREGLTILVSEQNLHFARLVADRALIIEKGQIRFDGTMAELEADEETRNAYLSV